jgi:hypothetical protein
MNDKHVTGTAMTGSLTSDPISGGLVDHTGAALFRAPRPLPRRGWVAAARSALVIGVCAVLLGGCRGLLTDPASRPKGISVTLASTSDILAYSGGENAAAYAKADRVRFQVQVSGEEVEVTEYEVLKAFSPAFTVPVTIEIPASEQRVLATIRVEILNGDAVLFRGSSEVVIEVGLESEVEINLSPILAGFRIAGDSIREWRLTNLNGADSIANLTAGAFFASGDEFPIDEKLLSWETSNARVVTVLPNGQINHIGVGTAVIRAAYLGSSDEVEIRVACVNGNQC